MVEQPPSSHQNVPPKDWSLVVGGPQKNVNTLTNTGPTAQTSPAEDKPPEDSKEDLVKLQTAADMAANRGLREKYADKAYNLATGCLSMWVVLLGASGIINALQGREMWSDKVIIAVTTGVTVSVLAAFLGVIRGLFPNHATQKK